MDIIIYGLIIIGIIGFIWLRRMYESTNSILRRWNEMIEANLNAGDWKEAERCEESRDKEKAALSKINNMSWVFFIVTAIIISARFG